MKSKMPDYQKIISHIDGLPWCALCTTGRTGTSLLQSLMDSHPQVFVFNGELYLHKFWGRSVVVAYGGDISGDDLAREFIGFHIEKFKSIYDYAEKKAELGENHDQSINIDLDEYRGHLTGLLQGRPITSKTFIQAVFAAYALAIGEDVFAKKLFLHNVHHITDLGPFIADFPEAKAIAMTRDPRAAYVSGVDHWRKFDAVTDNPSFAHQIFKRAVNDAQAFRNFNIQHRCLRLEDLGSEDMLKAVCDWLGISFDPALNHSTWAGLRWWGDRLSLNKAKKEETGFSSTVIKNKWEERLAATDKMVIDYLLEDRLRWYGYACSATSGAAAALKAFIAILVPTTFEREYFTPSYQVSCLSRGRLKPFVRIYYHYLRRVVYFYGLFLKKHFGQPFNLPFFAQTQQNQQDKK